MTILFFLLASLTSMAEKKKEVATCNKDLLFIFGLSGYNTPSANKNKFCKETKQNCCNKLDQLRVLRYIRNIMPAKYT